MSDFVVEVAGYRKQYLSVSTGASCGDIENGVAFAHWGTKEFNGQTCEGGWVISFEDLERIYNAAKACR